MARYVKLLVDRGYNPWGHRGILSVAELRVFDGSNTNIALNKQVTESSCLGVNHVGNKVVDGFVENLDNIWATAENTGLVPNGSQWVQIDLGSNYSINRIELVSFYSRGYGCITDYRILLSNNGVGWWLAAQITNKAEMHNRTDIITDIKKSIYYLYKKNKTIWGMSNGVFGKLIDNWDDLDDTSKKTLFTETGCLTPTITDLTTLEKFRTLVYTEDNDQQNVTVTAAPKDQLIMPRGLISLGSFDDIDKVALTRKMSGNGACRLIVTNDLKTYQTYDFEKQAWNPIDHADLVVVKQSGIDAAALQNIDPAAWDKLLRGKSGIGFAYLMGIDAITDQCAIDQITLQADMKGTWK